MKVNIEILESGKNLPLPSYAHEGDAGMDLYAAIPSPIWIASHQTRKIPTGIKIAIPQGYVGFVCPRSGLALRSYLTVLNGPGVVDENFRGEIGVLLHNDGAIGPVEIAPEMRIAQLVIVPVARAEWNVVEKLDETDRGESGFGSTG